MTTQDLTTEELGYTLHRITRVLDRWPAVPLPALNYRIGEVGSSRISSRQLARALSELSNNPRPRHELDSGPWQPLPGIIVTARESADRARRLAAEAAEAAARIASADYSVAFESLTNAVAQTLGSLGDLAEVPRDSSAVSSDSDILMHDALFPNTPIGGGTAATIWLSHSLEHLYPDDPRLWHALARASASGERLLIVARTITPAAFPFFRALGIQALQYYSVLVPDEAYSDLSVAGSRLGWPHVRKITDISGHRLLGHVSAAARRIVESPTVPSDAVPAVKEGLDLGFEVKRDIAAWATWAGDTAESLGLSAAWVTTVRRWAAWDAHLGRECPFPTDNAPAMRPPLTDAAPRRLRRPGSGQRVDSKSERGEEPIQQSDQVSPFGRETRIIPLGIRIS